MNRTYLLLGSNMGNSKKQLATAISNIEKKIGRMIRKSGIYQTEAWGKTDQPDFLNQVIEVETNLSAQKTMDAILDIESNMGRVRTEKNAPRVIDIDILFFNKELHDEPGLTIPHPALAQRRFVLIPLNELAPDFLHPLFHKTIQQLLIECTDTLNVKKI